MYGSWSSTTSHGADRPVGRTYWSPLASPRRSPSTPAAASAPPRRHLLLGHRAAVGLDQHRHRREHARRERLLEQLEALDRLDRLLEEGRGRVVDLVREQPEGAGDEHDQRSRPAPAPGAAGRGRRSAARRRAAGSPRARGRRRRSPRRGQKPRRPKIVSSAGSSVSPASIALRDADRGHRAERRGVARVRDDQDQHRQRHGQPAGEDRGAGPAQGAAPSPSCLSSVRAQLLAQSRDQQQAVVGADAEHQHDQDRGRVRGDGRAALRQQVDEARWRSCRRRRRRSAASAPPAPRGRSRRAGPARGARSRTAASCRCR